MKRVLHISTKYPPNIGGVEQTARDIVESLSDDFEQIVLCFNHEKGEKNEDINGVKIYRVKTDFKISSQSISFGYKKFLKKILREFNPDIIHFHFPNPYAARFLLKCKINCKLIVHWHSDIVKQKFLKVFFKGQTKRLLGKADKIIATSSVYAEKSEFLPLFKNKITIIPSCINEPSLVSDNLNESEAYKIKGKYPNKIICFFMGRHVTYKGLEYLIEGLPYLKENIQVVIAGQGPLTEDLKKKADGQKNIDFIGRIERKQLISYLIACDMFLFPSITKNEAFGLALAEAMYFGKPAVTFTIEGSGVNFVSLNGITGIECENRNSKAFSEAINKLAVDTELRKTLGDNARQRVSDNFLIYDFKNRINQLYKELI